MSYYIKKKGAIHMWNRAELKYNARTAFKKNYMPSVVVAVLVMFTMNLTITVGQGAVDQKARAFFALSGGAVFLINVFISNVFEVGACTFFIENRTSQPSALLILGNFKKPGYMNVVLVQLLRMVKTFLWTLLFIVPGIVKMYEYRMVPYILAEDPELEQSEVFRISRQMMSGRKMELFILDLSFFGWTFLSAMTFGLLGFFYVNPYIQATLAEVYCYNKTTAR